MTSAKLTEEDAVVESMDPEALDFAVMAWREEGAWRVEALPAREGTSVARLLRSLTMLPAEAGAIGLVSVADDFFVILRVDGADSRVLLSDAAAAFDWSLAREVLELLEIPVPLSEEVEEFEPAGDLGLLADLGLPAAELSILCHDGNLYPDEVLESVAARVGFADQFRVLFDEVGQG